MKRYMEIYTGLYSGYIKDLYKRYIEKGKLKEIEIPNSCSECRRLKDCHCSRCIYHASRCVCTHENFPKCYSFNTLFEKDWIRVLKYGDIEDE